MPPFSATVVKHGTFHPNDQFSNFRGRCISMLLATARKAFATMESFGIVRHSNSPWASPLHMVPKMDGSWRLCSNFRHLNDIATQDCYPTPHSGLFHSSRRHVDFLKVDQVLGYHQVPMCAENMSKTAVITPVHIFQRLMDSVLCDLSFVFVYLDDILVASQSADKHLLHLKLWLTSWAIAFRRRAPFHCLLKYRRWQTSHARLF